MCVYYLEYVAAGELRPRVGEIMHSSRLLAGGFVAFMLLALSAIGVVYRTPGLVPESRIVTTRSMIPTIRVNDRVLVGQRGCRIGPGDIVVFDDPKGEHPQLVKRVVAVGGQTVDLQGGRLIVDRKVVQEPYTNDTPTVPLTPEVTFPLTVPLGSLFVLGDNRTGSGDSRVFGPIPQSEIEGRVIEIYSPLGQIREIL